MDITSILNDMITSGLGLSLVGGAFVLWWLSGRIPNLFSDKEWSWKRGLEDLCKALLMGVLLVAGTGLLNLGGQFFAILGWDITEATQDVSTYVLAGAMAWGFVNYMSKAIKNAWAFFNLKRSELAGDKAKFDEGNAKIGEGVRAFIETITNKTSKEDIEAEVEEDDPIKEYVEVPEEEAGRGGVNNTYPEPYRSRPQDSMTDPSTCYNRECVSYTAWKIAELTGKWPTRTGGMNAKYWVQRLAENGYTNVVAKPQNGGKYVGVSEAGQYGHVVWFEEGETISEYNYSIRGGFSVRIVNPAAYKWVEIKAPAAPKPAPQPEKKPEQKPAPAKKPESKPAPKKDNSISYTYKAGDTFGQVIIDLGLRTSHSMWGPDGDVAYYTAQLNAQGISGNIPIGTTIKLTPRS